MCRVALHCSIGMHVHGMMECP